MNTVEMLGRLLVSLAFVLGLMWLLARRVKRPAKASSRLVDVLSRQQLSRTASVAVVRVGDQALILGVTEGQVSVLGEADLAQVQAQLDSESVSKQGGKPARGASRRSRTAAGGALPAGPPLTVPTVNPGATKPAGQAAAPGRHSTEPGDAPAITQAEARKALSGSALSPDTWRQTLDALRDLTVRTK